MSSFCLLFYIQSQILLVKCVELTLAAVIAFSSHKHYLRPRTVGCFSGETRLILPGISRYCLGLPVSTFTARGSLSCLGGVPLQGYHGWICVHVSPLPWKGPFRTVSGHSQLATSPFASLIAVTSCHKQFADFIWCVDEADTTSGFVPSIFLVSCSLVEFCLVIHFYSVTSLILLTI